MKHTITASLIALSLVLAPTSAFATESTTTAYPYKSDYANYSIEELTALIAKLTKQLEELKKTTTQCFVSDKDLSIGDGEAGDGLSSDVARLQSFLREKGYFQFPKNTGFFGKVTRTSLIAFQNASGVPATGDFDAATRAKAHALSCSKANSMVTKTEPYKDNANKPEKQAGSKTPVSAITLSTSGTAANWTANGYSKEGFKVVWSKNSGPTYPTRDGDKYIYLSDPGAVSTTLDAFNGSGTYYVRVCEYLGGSCGVYSNETQTQL